MSANGPYDRCATASRQPQRSTAPQQGLHIDDADRFGHGRTISKTRPIPTCLSYPISLGDVTEIRAKTSRFPAIVDDRSTISDRHAIAAFGREYRNQ